MAELFDVEGFADDGFGVEVVMLRLGVFDRALVVRATGFFLAGLLFSVFFT